MTNEADTPATRPLLIAEAGPERGREITVPEGEISLGRSSENDVCLVDPILSRHHCRVSFHGGVLAVEGAVRAGGLHEVLRTIDDEIRKRRFARGDGLEGAGAAAVDALEDDRFCKQTGAQRQQAGKDQ